MSLSCGLSRYTVYWSSIFLYFFFFKQKTAYEMRISDWSSDVCSSDLGKKEYEWMRKEVRIWNTRFNDPHQQMRRYSAAIAIVKEAIKKNLTIHEAYAFALTSEPLLDKQEDENGYRITKDVAKIWRRDTGIKPSATPTDKIGTASGRA